MKRKRDGVKREKKSVKRKKERCIKAGCGIKAGWGIEAGEGIKAGWEHGIYAGLRVKVTNREYRAIRAKNKPDNIMCGEWMEQ